MHWVFDRSNFMNSLQKLPLSAVPVHSSLFPLPFSSPLFFLRLAQLPGSDNYIFSRAMELKLLPTKFKRVTIFMAKTPCLWRHLTEVKDDALLTTRLAKIQNKKSFACAHKKLYFAVILKSELLKSRSAKGKAAFCESWVVHYEDDSCPRNLINWSGR